MEKTLQKAISRGHHAHCMLSAIYSFMFFPYDLMASQASMLLGGHDPHLELQNATKIGRQHFEVGIWP